MSALVFIEVVGNGRIFYGDPAGGEVGWENVECVRCPGIVVVELLVEVLSELRLLSDASWRGSGSFPKGKAVNAHHR